MLRAVAQGGGGTFSTLTLTGQGLFADGTAAAPGMAFSAQKTLGWWRSASNQLTLAAGGVNQLTFSPSGQSYSFNSSAGIGWTSGDSLQTQDVTLLRDAANTLALRNGVLAQGFRLANTFTDQQNFERGILQWTGNIWNVGTESAGTGAERSMKMSAGMAFTSRFVSGSYSVLTNDYTICCSTATSTLTVQLPLAPTPGSLLNIKKISTDANRLTIDGNGILIDGAAMQSTIGTNNPSFKLQLASNAVPGTNSWVIL